jgi:xanthine dehydrogenase accessory factor
MSLDPTALAAAVAGAGRLARVLVAEVRGSAPREAGAAMLVWGEGAGAGQAGTIGGGALEWEAAARARALLAAPPGAAGAAVWRQALGPDLGQCCGGRVTLVAEVIDADWLAAHRPEGGVLARPVAAQAGPMPAAMARRLAAARAGAAALPAPLLSGGWLAEAVAAPGRPLWIWGAGHVGRALVAVLSPLPGLALTWADIAATRFPPVIPEGVQRVIAPDPAALAATIPAGARHLVLTHSHALDLALCHALLAGGAARVGLIGSATKRARFLARLAALGHPPARLAALDCPIGDPALGKHPQAIAISVAAAILAGERAGAARVRHAG